MLIPLLLILAVFLFIWVMTAKAEPLDTYHSSWHLVRALAAEDAADFATALPLATSEGDFANKPAAAFRIPARNIGLRSEGYSAGSKWMFAFLGVTTDTDDDSETFSFTLVGWAKTNGMAQVICDGDGAIGTQDVVVYPGGSAADPNSGWADTLSVDATTKWPRDGDANNVMVYNSGNNQVAILVVETTGLEYIYPFIYDAAGSAEATSIAVYGRRY